MACHDLPPALCDLLGTQHLAVLATHREGQPYASLVALSRYVVVNHFQEVTEYWLP